MKETWHVRPDYGKENVYRIWDEQDNYHDDTSPEKMDQRARIIEAAPDLLAALKSIMTGGNHLALHISNSFGEHPAHDATHEEAAKFYKVGVPGWDGNAWKYDVWICWRTIMQARDAIAKAEGKETPHERRPTARTGARCIGSREGDGVGKNSRITNIS